MQKIKRWGLVLVVAIIAAIIAPFIYHMLAYLPLPQLDNVSGTNIRLGDSHDRVIATMGTPHDLEIIERDNASHLYILHYDGISFLLSGNNWVTFLDITGEQYRLGGRSGNRVGVGSTRSEVEAELERRREITSWLDGVPRFSSFQPQGSRSLPNADFGFVSTQTWLYVEFVFENDIVTKMRIGRDFI